MFRRIIIGMTLIGVLALVYWGGFIHWVTIKGASCVSRTDLEKGVRVHQTFLLTMDHKAFKKNMIERFPCIEDIHIRPTFGAIDVDVLSKEIVFLISPLTTSIDVRMTDDALVASLSALEVSKGKFGLSREGIVVPIDGETKDLPSLEYVGRLAAGEEIPNIASIPWKSVLDKVKDMAGEIERALIVEDSIMILVRRPEPMFFFFPIEDSLFSTVEESERMLRVLEQDKKRVTRLDRRFSRPVVRYAPSH